MEAEDVGVGGLDFCYYSGQAVSELERLLCTVVAEGCDKVSRQQIVAHHVDVEGRLDSGFLYLWGIAGLELPGAEGGSLKFDCGFYH